MDWGGIELSKKKGIKDINNWIYFLERKIIEPNML